MVGYLNLLLRLTIWFLLTANLSLANLVIGGGIALLLPHRQQAVGTLRDWLQILRQVLLAIPLAYLEAFEMIVRPHQQEGRVLERAKPRRTAGLVFLDIFLITFTPKTIVTKYHEAGWYEVHQVQRGRQP